MRFKAKVLKFPKKSTDRIQRNKNQMTFDFPVATLMQDNEAVFLEY